MKKRIHWNLHKGGLVVRNHPNIVGDMTNPKFYCLKDCTFVVQGSTRDRIRKGIQSRSVHAWVQGSDCNCGKDDGIAVRYNPHRDLGFNVEGKVMSSAEHVSVRALGTGKGAGYEIRARNAR